MARASNKQNKQNLTEQAEREGDALTCEERERVSLRVRHANAKPPSRHVLEVSLATRPAWP